MNHLKTIGETLQLNHTNEGLKGVTKEDIQQVSDQIKGYEIEFHTKSDCTTVQIP